jgi:hypothetical protein
MPVRTAIKDAQVRTESIVFSSDFYVKMFLGYKPARNYFAMSLLSRGAATLPALAPLPDTFPLGQVRGSVRCAGENL